MKRLLSIMGGLLGLLVLGALAVALALTFGGLGRSAEPASQAFQSPIETPTQPPYPIPATPTRPSVPTIPPTVTPAPKPSPIPTPIPTATPVPTPLPLPPSAFYALWAENYPEGQGSVLWLADPRDIGSRREVLRFERDAIIEAALSPNGRKLALVTSYWKTSTLWIANIDGIGLQQLDQSIPLGIRNLFWSRDSHVLAYKGVVAAETILIDKTGTPVVEPALSWTIDLLDPATSQKQHLVQAHVNEDLSLLGWSADGQELYYIRSMPQYGLWSIAPSTGKSHLIVTLGDELVLPILSPDGSKFLISTPEGFAWISATGQIHQNIPAHLLKGLRGYIWSPNMDELVLCQVDEKQPIQYIKVFNLHSGATRTLTSLKVSPSGRPFWPLALSPDMQWMVAAVDEGEIYWIHLPTGATVPVPGHTKFIAWMPANR